MKGAQREARQAREPAICAGPRLSVCIPTFQRAGQLGEMLQSLEAAVAALEPGQRAEMEVLVSDNASADGTAEVVESFRHRLPGFRSWRNVSNLGAEGNVQALFSQARGEYVWIFGDDDRMVPDALARLFPQLELGYGLILLNFSVWSADFGRCLLDNGRRLRLDEADLGCQALLRRHGLHVGFISTAVLHRRLIECLNPREYERTAAYQSATLYLPYSGLLKTGLTARFSAMVSVQNRGAAPSYDSYRAFEGCSLTLALLGWEGYSRRAVRSARSQMLSEFLLIHIGSEARRGRIARGRIMALGWRHFRGQPLFWVLIAPILLAPAALVRGARTCFAWILRRHYASAGAPLS